MNSKSLCLLGGGSWVLGNLCAEGLGGEETCRLGGWGVGEGGGTGDF